MLRPVLATAALSLLVAFQEAPEAHDVPVPPPARAHRNVLLVVLDDVGVDRVGAYAEHPSPGKTPTLDRLADEGVLFRNCWANPYCSPTRATLLTGRYGFRTGIGHFIRQGAGRQGLASREWTIPRVLQHAAEGVYHTAALGKWHLADYHQSRDHPRKTGFDYHAGAFENLLDYERWVKHTNGDEASSDVYPTTDTTDEAIGAIERFGAEPWFLYVAYNAAHTPYHAPPAHLHDFPLEELKPETRSMHHKAMVQAMDRELGRLLESIPADVAARTTVIVVGDNGTQGTASEPPTSPDHGKGTLYDGGIRVPLIIAGAAVSPQARGRECAALVNTTDLFATTLGLCGVDARATVPAPRELDSLDAGPYLVDPALTSRRDVLFAEHFKPNHPDGNYELRQFAVGDGRYKLIRDALTGEELLFDLVADPREERDLLAAAPGPDTARIRRDLGERLARILGE